MANIFSRAQMIPTYKRRTAFAGTWYEGDSQKLKSQLSDYLQKADDTLQKKSFDESFKANKATEGTVLAAIAPHAGYVFSGQTAAFSYDLAKRRKINRVFLLGPSHYVGIQGVALPADKTFATPLGDLEVDTRTINELNDFPLFEIQPNVHKNEHSLELQLPLIKASFGDVKIVPLIVGQLQDEMEIRLIAQMIKRFIGEDDIVIVSSDFTHYGPRYDYEPFKNSADTDDKTAYGAKISTKIKELDENAFTSLMNCDLTSFINFRESTQDTICGYYPCAVLLAMLPPGTQATLLDYRTSRDTVQENEFNSVSYMALVFSNKKIQDKPWQQEKKSPAQRSHLSDASKAALLKLARETLSEFVINKKTPDAKKLIAADVALEEPRGTFVTLYTHPPKGESERPDGKGLRGCIGYIWPVKSLAEAVIDNTVGAAARDPRFTPVSFGEINDLQIDINVLTPLSRVDSYKDIVIGRDGIVMYKHGRQAVFLPSVATEFGWNLEETLSQLSLKAGCGRDGWRDGARFDIFQSESFEENEPAIKWPEK